MCGSSGGKLAAVGKVEAFAWNLAKQNKKQGTLHKRFNFDSGEKLCNCKGSCLG